MLEIERASAINAGQTIRSRVWIAKPSDNNDDTEEDEEYEVTLNKEVPIEKTPEGKDFVALFWQTEVRMCPWVGTRY